MSGDNMLLSCTYCAIPDLGEIEQYIRYHTLQTEFETGYVWGIHNMLWQAIPQFDMSFRKCSFSGICVHMHHPYLVLVPPSVTGGQLRKHGLWSRAI